jgi:hypothetical protein
MIAYLYCTKCQFVLREMALNANSIMIDLRNIYVSVSFRCPTCQSPDPIILQFDSEAKAILINRTFVAPGGEAGILDSGGGYEVSGGL